MKKLNQVMCIGVVGLLSVGLAAQSTDPQQSMPHTWSGGTALPWIVGHVSPLAGSHPTIGYPGAAAFFRLRRAPCHRFRRDTFVTDSEWACDL